MKTYMRSASLALALILAGTLFASSVQAETIAWWRFENGIAGDVIPGTTMATVYQEGVPDSSGNGNSMAAFWDDGANATVYNANTPPAVSGTNFLSAQNPSSGSPSMFTWSAESGPSGTDLETAVLTSWTIEAFIFPTANGTHRTFVGRDGFATDQAAPLYFKIWSGGGDPIIRCEMRDQSEVIHLADGTRVIENNKWYYVAAVSDGSTLTVYSANLTDGDTVATVDGTPVNMAAASSNTAFGPFPDAEPADATQPVPRASWSVGRGYWNHGDVDRFFGNIDEVRISNTALNVPVEGLLATGLPVVSGTMIEVTAPVNQDEFLVGESVTLTAEVSDGTIDGDVEFYINGTLIDTVSSAGTTYTTSWTAPLNGNYTITVVGKNSGGDIVDPGAPTITVGLIDYDVTGGGDGVDGTASASSEFNGPTYFEQALEAFDNDPATFWTGSNTLATENPAWIQFQLNTPASINAFSLMGRAANANRLPRDFTVQGSNNGTDFTVLATVEGHDVQPRTEFEIGSQTAAYSYYRMSITNLAGTENDGVDGTAEPNAMEIEFLAFPNGGTTLSADNMNAAYGEPVTLTASTAGYDGTITQVEFFNGPVSLGLGTPIGNGEYELEIVTPTEEATLSISSLTTTDTPLIDISENILTLGVTINAVDANVWTLY